MKKFILIILTVIVSILVYVNVNAMEYDIVIPDLAIRVRVIANSNSLYDQSMKMKVKNIIEREISPLLIGIDNVDDARNIINDNLDMLDSSIEVLFSNNEYNKEYFSNFGNNYFTEKDYRGIH